jgi:hypothetical protein
MAENANISPCTRVTSISYIANNQRNAILQQVVAILRSQIRHQLGDEFKTSSLRHPNAHRPQWNPRHPNEFHAKSTNSTQNQQIPRKTNELHKGDERQRRPQDEASVVAPSEEWSGDERPQGAKSPEHSPLGVTSRPPTASVGRRFWKHFVKSLHVKTWHFYYRKIIA